MQVEKSKAEEMEKRWVVVEPSSQVETEVEGQDGGRWRNWRGSNWREGPCRWSCLFRPVQVSGSPALASCLTTNAACCSFSPPHRPRHAPGRAPLFSPAALPKRIRLLRNLELERCRRRLLLHGATPGRLGRSRWAGPPLSLSDGRLLYSVAHQRKVLTGAPTPEKAWMPPTNLQRVSALRGERSPDDTSCCACKSQPIGYFPINNRQGPPPL
jgi:hypothetical protein